MAKIVFETKKGPVLTVLLPDGGSLADVCDEKNAPIPFSCRSASCGTCCIEVLEGEAQLLSPADEELDVLDALDRKAPGYRLSCQAIVKDGDGLLRIRSVDEV